MKRILIRAGEITAPAELNDNPTAQKVWEALPITARGNRWGDEIYFAIPVKMGSEAGARADVKAGELGYWPPGNAFCIFFGPTPASDGPEPRAASPVNILGKITADAAVFRRVKDGAQITLEKAEDSA